MKLLIYSLLTALLLSLNSALYAAPDDISKQQAVDIAMQTYPGRVLSVKRKSGVYLVKTLSENGRVQVVKIDARTGQVVTGGHAGKHSGR